MFSAIDITVFASVKQVLWLVNITITLVAISFIIMAKKDPTKTLSWIAVVALFEIVGVILYLTFGRNFRKERLFSKKNKTDKSQIEHIYHKQLNSINDYTPVEEDLDITKLLWNNNRSLLTRTNKVEILNNGEATFGSILEAIGRAKRYIHLEFYIVEDDQIGNIVAEALIAKAQQGVEIRLIYDDVGSWSLGSRFVNRLKQAGIKVYAFMPVAFPWFTSRINYRDHRKILIVDGKVGFTGGVNIADRYLKSGKREMWRDTHIKIEGSAVAMLHLIFMTDWHFVSKEELNAKIYLKPHPVDHNTPIQIASSGPDSNWASIMQTFFYAISSAKEHIYIVTPYFMPNQAILTALKVASLKGVDIRLLIPSRSDSKIVYCATRSYIDELLNAGIKIFMYQKGFVHSKLIMIDSEYCSVGTANMDIRSFEYNLELSALIYDKEVTKELESYFIADLADSKELNIKQWSKRSRKEYLLEALARLFSPFL